MSARGDGVVVLNTPNGRFTGLERRPKGRRKIRGTVLIMHGFPDDHRSFMGLAEHLAAAGYRAIAPVMRGYEPSSQRPGAIYPSHLADDVIAWMDVLELEHAHVVGHDWGAVAGYAAAGLAPERVLSLTTMAVPPLQQILSWPMLYPHQLRLSWYMGFFQLPLVPERVLKRGFLDRLWREWGNGAEPSPTALARVHERFAMPGVIPSALSYYRAFAQPNTPEGKRSQKLLFSPIAVPTLAMSGADDGCMETALFDLALGTDDFPAGLKVMRVQRATHWLHLEQPDEVNTAVVDWVARHASG